MDKETELSLLERELTTAHGEEMLELLRKIRILEKELYPQNEEIFKSFLEPVDKAIEEKHRQSKKNPTFEQ